MSVSTMQNIKEKVWDEVGPKLIRILRDSYAPLDPDTVAEEIFEQIWPDIFKEMLHQVQMAQEGLLAVAVNRNFPDTRT